MINEFNSRHTHKHTTYLSSFFISILSRMMTVVPPFFSQYFSKPRQFTPMSIIFLHSYWRLLFAILQPCPFNIHLNSVFHYPFFLSLLSAIFIIIILDIYFRMIVIMIMIMMMAISNENFFYFSFWLMMISFFFLSSTF